jgi:very-short-patch-repair endonuclease
MAPTLLHSIAALAALTVLAGAVLALARERRSAASFSDFDRPWPLESEGTLLTDTELVLYRRLVQAAPEHIVLSQVQLQQMIRFRRGARRQSIANRINQLCVDFLIVEPDTSIVAAIELDDASHFREDRRWADARKTHALRSAGIPLLRWNVRQLPTVRAIEVALSDLRTGRAANPRTPAPAPRAYS